MVFGGGYFDQLSDNSPRLVMAYQIICLSSGGKFSRHVYFARCQDNRSHFLLSCIVFVFVFCFFF